MVGVLAKSYGDAKLSDAQRFSRFLHDPSNLEFYKWSFLPINEAVIDKRSTLFDHSERRRA